MIGEFDLPEEIVDRKVTKMKMISPSNREVDVGRTLSEKEYIGMCRREVLDDFLRKRASKAGANVINGLFMRLEQVMHPCMPGCCCLLRACAAQQELWSQQRMHCYQQGLPLPVGLLSLLGRPANPEQRWQQAAAQGAKHAGAAAHLI